jgi:hypothetical protein
MTSLSRKHNFYHGLLRRAGYTNAGKTCLGGLAVAQ